MTQDGELATNGIDLVHEDGCNQTAPCLSSAVPTPILVLSLGTPGPQDGAPAADGIDLVHEDDAGLVVPGVPKHLANDACALANVLVDDGG